MEEYEKGLGRHEHRVKAHGFNHAPFSSLHKLGHGFTCWGSFYSRLYAVGIHASLGQSPAFPCCIPQRLRTARSCRLCAVDLLLLSYTQVYFTPLLNSMGGEREDDALQHMTNPSLPSSPAAGTEDNLTYPEGGLQGWLVVLGSFCASFSVFGVINTAAVFESFLSEHQLADENKSNIGWIFSTYLFTVYSVGIFVGPCFDRYGPRVLLAVGGVLMVAGPMTLSWCTGKYRDNPE